MILFDTSGFASFFHAITGHLPYDYQNQIAGLPVEDCLIGVPTGCGKTAAVTGAWLWHICQGHDGIPKRLIYCLPMRVLVEQTRDLARVWAERSGTGTKVFTLMGGEIEDDWAIDPEKPSILVGTQDQLLSRALNRGYAMSRYRWPVHFGLLNNDCLWVCDEIQLMGNGPGTTAQLQAFRRRWGAFGPTATWWMSATADREWLHTVDYEDARKIRCVAVGKEDRDAGLAGVYRAVKPVQRLDILDRKGVEKLHHPGTLTVVVCNTVARARELYTSLDGKLAAETLLIHSRFRPPDRKRTIARLLLADSALRGSPVAADEQDAGWLDRVRQGGLIAVTTQVIEAGVDLSAETLITELAPWPSIVQRLGRCNRQGKQNQGAQVRWVPLPDKLAAPYDPAQLRDAREKLERLTDGSVSSVAEFGAFAGGERTHVVRQHDIHGLFSTEPDLAGGFTDISAYVRGVERDAPVHLFWREKPLEDEPAPCPDELCPAPLNDELKTFLKAHRAREWNGETEKWEPRGPNDVRPGMTLLLAAADGGYRDNWGWTGNPEDHPTTHTHADRAADSLARDLLSAGPAWYLLSRHLLDAEAEARRLVESAGLTGTAAGRAVVMAARWHDAGKSHARWQAAVPEIGESGGGPWAKFPRGSGRAFRPGMRHEAASALCCFDQWQAGRDGWTALAVYLVAAHHGRVRTVLRSRERGAQDVFGIRAGDTLPALTGWLDAEYPVSLACRLFAASGEWLQDDEAFRVGAPSWAGMVAELLGPETGDDVAPGDAVPESEPRHLGPFRLAYLEALAVAADVRASRTPGAGGER